MGLGLGSTTEPAVIQGRFSVLMSILRLTSSLSNVLIWARHLVSHSTPPSLGKIKHLIIIHRFCDDSDNPGLAQTLLVVERLVRAHSRLTSLFIFLERDMHLPRLPLADWCLAMWGLIWPFLSPLMILCKQSPNIHVHISTYTREEPRPHPGPLGPHLCADSAASVRSYLLTRELDGGINGWNISPGVSFSNITVDSSFTSSADGRYLLEFGQNESYVMEMPGWGMTRRDTVRRSYLQRALRWHDHRGLLELDDPWFHYTLTTTDNEPSAFYELRSVCSALQLRLASGGLMPWTQWSPGFLSRDIEKSLWEFNSPASSLVKPEGADLRTVTAEWARLRLEELAEFDSERDNEHLNRLFVAMALFDAASAAGQRRITNYFAKVRVGDNLPM